MISYKLDLQYKYIYYKRNNDSFSAFLDILHSGAYLLLDVSYKEA
jgi:hypothetical protein